MKMILDWLAANGGMLHGAKLDPVLHASPPPWPTITLKWLYLYIAEVALKGYVWRSGRTPGGEVSESPAW